MEEECLKIEETQKDNFLVNFPKAALSIEYREEIADAWARIKILPVEFVSDFLKAVEEDPKLGVLHLEERIINKHKKSLSPFDDETLANCYIELKSISDEAAEEFEKVVKLMGDTLNPIEVTSKIKKKFS